MISPHTAPGTKVVYVGDAGKGKVVVCLGSQTYGPIEDSPPFVVGQAYTVDRIEPFPCDVGFVVFLVETPYWFTSIAFVRRADLPDCLTTLLEIEPVRDEVDA